MKSKTKIAVAIVVALGLYFAIPKVWQIFWTHANGPTERKWMEDVVLDDGSTIVVKRTVKFNETNALGGGAHNTIEKEATISFTGTLASLPTWSQALMGMVMYRDATKNGQWVVVATTTTCPVWNARGEPRPPYWEFRLTSAGWQEVPLSAASIGRPTNLHKGYNSLDELFDPQHVTPSDRLLYDRDASPEYRSIQANAQWNC
jgi:hypothetical protein